MLPGRKKRILAFFNRRFGKNPLESFDAQRCRDRLAQVRILHDAFLQTDEENTYAVDEVTWTDLEMDEVFLRINQTGSYIGEQVLYRVLHSGNEAFFRENRQLMEVLADNERIREELALRLYPIGKKQANYYLPEFFANAGLLRPGKPWIFRVLQGFLVLAVCLAVIFRSVPCYMMLAAALTVNFVVYIMMKTKYDVLLSSLSGIGQVLELFEWIGRQEGIPLPESGSMKEHAGKLRKIRKKIGFLVYTKQASLSGDVTGLLFDYLFGITLVDVGRIDGILKLIDAYREEVLDAFVLIGKLDAAISILSFRNSLPHWSLPVLADGRELAAQGLYHPLLKEPVSNDFTLRDRAILTGANASGKSTLMKKFSTR